MRSISIRKPLTARRACPGATAHSLYGASLRCLALLLLFVLLPAPVSGEMQITLSDNAYGPHSFHSQETFPSCQYSCPCVDCNPPYTCTTNTGTINLYQNDMWRCGMTGNGWASCDCVFYLGEQQYHFDYYVDQCATGLTQEIFYIERDDDCMVFSSPGQEVGPFEICYPKDELGDSDEQNPDGDDCLEAMNSYAEERGRIFHEDIALPGTEFDLHYVCLTPRSCRFWTSKIRKNFELEDRGGGRLRRPRGARRCS